MKIFSILLISFLVLGVFTQGFSGIITGQNCWRDSDCIGSDVCHVRQCVPILKLRKCDMSTFGGSCGFEYLCEDGVCRYTMDIMAQKHLFGPNMKCKQRIDCPPGMTCFKGNCT